MRGRAISLSCSVLLALLSLGLLGAAIFTTCDFLFFFLNFKSCDRNVRHLKSKESF